MNRFIIFIFLVICNTMCSRGNKTYSKFEMKLSILNLDNVS